MPERAEGKSIWVLVIFENLNCADINHFVNRFCEQYSSESCYIGFRRKIPNLIHNIHPPLVVTGVYCRVICSTKDDLRLPTIDGTRHSGYLGRRNNPTQFLCSQSFGFTTAFYCRFPGAARRDVRAVWRETEQQIYLVLPALRSQPAVAPSPDLQQSQSCPEKSGGGGFPGGGAFLLPRDLFQGLQYSPSEMGRPRGQAELES